MEDKEIKIQLPSANHPSISQSSLPKPIQDFRLFAEGMITPGNDWHSLTQDTLINLFVPGFIVSIRDFIPILLKVIILFLFVSLFWLLWQFSELRIFLAVRLAVGTTGALLGYV